MRKIISIVIALLVMASCYGQPVNELKSNGFAKLQKQDYKGALTDLNKAVVTAPQDVEVLAGIGMAKFMLDDYSGALTALTKAIELQPHPDYYYLRSLAKMKLKDNNGAIADLNKLIENDPKNAEAFLMRATLKEKEADYRGAIDDYNKVIEIDPKNSQAFHSRGLSKIMVNPNDDRRPWCLDFDAAIQLGHPTALEDKIKRGCR